MSKGTIYLYIVKINIFLTHNGRKGLVHVAM